MKEFALALSKVQSEIAGAKAKIKNEFFKRKYADLAGVWEAIRAPLTSHGFCVVQTTEFRDEKLGVVTRLIHSSGESIEGFTPVLNNKNDAQGMGSAITYARRYALAAIVGVYQEDDDGNAASKTTKEQILKTKPKTPEQSSYVCNAGKFAGKPIKDIAASELRSYCEDLELAIDKNNKDGKETPRWAIEFVAEARRILI